MSEDISRKAVIVLVVIAITVSILSTSLVMNAVYKHVPSDQGNVAEYSPSGRAILEVPQESPSAKVRLTVVNSQEDGS